MRLQHRTNNHILLSALFWGLIIGLASWLPRWLITNDKLIEVLWDVGNILALILYPLLVSLMLHRKTRLWINAFLFSAVGSMVASLLMLFLRTFQDGNWTFLALGLLSIGFIGQVIVPRFEQIPALQSEWSSPLWEKLNDLSFIEFLSLQLYSLNDHAG